MTRFIDADALKYDFGEIDDGQYKRTELYVTNEAIAKQPTIDAEPVRHGKWDKGTDSHWHICEECGAEVDISMGTGVWVEGVELRELKYCPNCGARMDEE